MQFQKDLRSTNGHPMGKLAIEQLGLGEADTAVFLRILDRLFQRVEQLGLI